MASFVNEFGFVAEADLLQTGFTVSRPNDPLEGVFTDQRTDNLVAEWYTLAAEYQVPQMAQFHAFDTEAHKSVRVPIDHHNIEKGLIKEKSNVSELLRQKRGVGVTAEDELYNYVIDDAARLVDAVVTRAKVARAEAIATGQVTIKENNLDLTVDYGVPSNHKNLTLDFTQGATSDILTQVQDIIDLATASGVVIDAMVCSNSFVSKLRRNTDVQTAINGSAASGAYVGRSTLDAFLSDEFGIQRVIIDDLNYAVDGPGRTNNRPNRTLKRYFPANRVSFIGTSNGMRFGVGLWGLPPEVDIARFSDVSAGTVSGASPYVYTMQWAEKDPAVIWTKASALYMPVLLNPNGLFIANVTE